MVARSVGVVLGKTSHEAYNFTMLEYFKSYAQGYEVGDFGRLEGHYSYPCMLTNETGTDLVCDADELHQDLAGFLVWLKQSGLAKAVPTILNDRQHGLNNRVVAVNWKMFGADGEVFTEFDVLYVLVGGDGAWKISLAKLI